MAFLRRWSSSLPEATPVPSQAPIEASSAAARTTERTWADWHAARRGDRSAAQRLVQALTVQAQGLAMRLLGRAEDADDAVQDAFMRLWRSEPRDDVGATLATYFNTIVINRCRTVLVARREWATDPEDLADLQDATPDARSRAAQSAQAPEARLDAAQQQAAIHHAMQQLPARQRLAVALWAYADRSVPEIAAEMELGVDAAHQLLTRAKRRLRDQLSERPEVSGSIR